MTVPSERTLALLRAREILLELSHATQPVDVPKLREKAEHALRHYPDEGMIELIACDSSWLAQEGAAPLFKRVVLPPMKTVEAASAARSEAICVTVRSWRPLIAAGELIPGEEFQARLGLTVAGLRSLAATGSVFSVDVDGRPYFPSVLAAEGVNRTRLYLICRMLWPAPAEVRLDFLESRWANLGDLKPVECLDDDKCFRLLRRMAEAFIVERYRTAISVYSGTYDAEPMDVAPSYQVAREADPRKSIWKRCFETMQSHGFSGVRPPYPWLPEATAFVCQYKSGVSSPDRQARLNIAIDGDVASVRVRQGEGFAPELVRVPVTGKATTEDALLAIFAALLAGERGSD